MCDLQTYIFPENSTINCSNYCGTVDEECNGSDLRKASCADIYCEGSGTPTCIDLCRLDYSSCNADDDQISFMLDLKTDDKGWETSWQILDNFNEPICQSDDCGKKCESEDHRNNATIREYRCMRTGCYKLILKDDRGNGI